MSSGFKELVGQIKDCLGKEAGIDTSNEHLEELLTSMRNYKSVEAEWSKFALADSSRAYTR